MSCYDCDELFSMCDDGLNESENFRHVVDELDQLRGVYCNLEKTCDELKQESEKLRMQIKDQKQRNKDFEQNIEHTRTEYEEKLKDRRKRISELECENRDLHMNVCDTRKNQVLLCQELRRRELHEQYLVKIKAVIEDVCFSKANQDGDDKRKKLNTYKSMLQCLEGRKKKLETELSKLERMANPCHEERDVESFLEKIVKKVTDCKEIQDAKQKKKKPQKEKAPTPKEEEDDGGYSKVTPAKEEDDASYTKVTPPKEEEISEP